MPRVDIFLGILLQFLIILVALAAISGSGDFSHSGTQDAQGNDNQTGGTAEPQSSYFSSPESLLSLVPFILILALVFFLAVQHIRADRTFVAEKETRTSETATLNKAIDILDKELDARSGILRAYAEMCTMLSDPDLEVSLTPKELERLVTDQLRWPKRPVHNLTELFQEARYSHHALEEEHKATALDSLNELKTILEERAHAQ